MTMFGKPASSRMSQVIGRFRGAGRV
jgi:hypothetical protein